MWKVVGRGCVESPWPSPQPPSARPRSRTQKFSPPKIQRDSHLQGFTVIKHPDLSIGTGPAVEPILRYFTTDHIMTRAPSVARGAANNLSESQAYPSVPLSSSRTPNWTMSTSRTRSQRSRSCPTPALDSARPWPCKR